MSEKTNSCPFCGAETWAVRQGGYWLVCGEHVVDCPVGSNGGMAVISLEAWNRRATQPAAPVAAGEPVAMQARMPGSRWENYHKDDSTELVAGGMEIRWLYTAPPAAAHGDEAKPMKLIGESHEEQGVVWTGKNPHAWPVGTKFYAMRAQSRRTVIFFRKCC